MFPDDAPLPPSADPIRQQHIRNAQLGLLSQAPAEFLNPTSDDVDRYDWERPVDPPAVTPLGNPLNLSAVATATCPSCGADAAGGRFCSGCGANLAQADDPVEQYLNLSDFSPNQRRELANRGEAQADGSFPIRNADDLKNAILAVGRAKNPAETKKWIIKRARALRLEGQIPDDWTRTDLSQEHGATVVAVDLAGEFQDGLLWKVLCKTGTLALSPGPGQVDVEQPLNLTPEMFLACKQAFDERAYEHVVIPTTHDGVYDVMRNTGEVQALEVLTKDQTLTDLRFSQRARDKMASDPDDTLYMLGGLGFTEPEVREKAERGSILNCSVGFKFNVRPNKFSGKLYPIAVEHVALTNQPWVYGMPAFGSADLSHRETPDPVEWDGVFLAAEAVIDTYLDRELQEILGTVEPEVENPHRDTPSGLSDLVDDGEVNRTVQPGEPETMSRDLETVLADQQAKLEAAEAQLQETKAELDRQRDVTLSQGQQLHMSSVAGKIRALEGRYHPALLQRAEQVLLADSPSNPTPGLNLSVTGAGTDGAARDMSATDIVDYLLAAVPPMDTRSYEKFIADMSLSQQRNPSDDEPTTQQKANDIERRLHPERFNEDGSRIPADKR